jgi:hypothetical protein
MERGSHANTETLRTRQQINTLWRFIFVPSGKTVWVYYINTAHEFQPKSGTKAIVPAYMAFQDGKTFEKTSVKHFYRK